MGQSAAATRGPIFSHNPCREVDPGAWNGHSCEDAPAIAVEHTTPEAVRTIRTLANSDVDHYHVLIKATREEGKEYLNHDRDTFREKVKRPPVEPVTLPLVVSATLDN